MVAHIARGAVAVVGHRFDDDGDAGGAVAFIGDGIVGVAAAGARGLLQHALDVVVGHIGGLGLGDDRRQTGVIVRIGRAAAFLHGDVHLLRDLGKSGSALCVLRTLRLLNVMPLGMSGHKYASSLIKFSYVLF